MLNIIEHTHDTHQQGSVWINALHHGMVYKYAQIQTFSETYKQDFYLSPDLRLIITLSGRTHLKVGRQNLCIKQPAHGMLLPVRDLEMGEKIFYQEQQNELVLFFSRLWLEDWCESRPRLRQALILSHLQPYYFPLNNNMLFQVEKLLQTKNLPESWQILHQEAQSIALLAEILTMLFPNDLAQITSPKPNEKRLMKLAEMLRQPEFDTWHLTDLARECGSNITTLQRDFVAQFGQNIEQYRRRFKLNLARDALYQGATPHHAMTMAGYTNMQSFGRAFKKEFGFSHLLFKA